jgi:hypothetical protein
MLQLVLYTTLWFDNTHVNYKIYQCPIAKKYVFKPTAESSRQPLFQVFKRSGQWIFDNMSNSAVQEQAIEDIENISKMKNVPLL